MARITKIILVISAALFLSSCSGQGVSSNGSTSPTPTSTSESKGSATASLRSTPNSLSELEKKIHESPREGGVREYLIEKGDDDVSSIDGTWESSLKLRGEFSIVWQDTQKATFIPVCNSETGKFTLYKNGKNIADGPCGPGQVIFLSPPKPKPAKNEVFSYEITGASKAEVALYIERKPK